MTQSRNKYRQPKQRNHWNTLKSFISCTSIPLEKSTAIDQEISHISLKQFIQSDQAIDELKHREVTVTVDELRWALDNIRSNEARIRKLKTRLDVFELQPTSIEQHEQIEKLTLEKLAIKERCVELAKGVKGQSDHIHSLENRVTELSTVNAGLDKLVTEQAEQITNMRTEYEAVICDMEMGHCETLLKIAQCRPADLHLNDKENFI